MPDFDRYEWNAELAARHLEEQKAVSREMWRDGCITCLQCVASCLVGLFLFGVAMHVTDYRLGIIYMWSGLILGNSGIIASVAGFYRHGEARGLW